MTKSKLISTITALAIASSATVSLTVFASDNNVISYSDGNVTTTKSGTLFAVSYNEDRTLAGIKLYDVSAGEPTAVAVADGSILMLWDSVNGMNPLSDTFTVSTETTEPTEQPTETAVTGFAVTFVTDEHASVTVYDTQDTTSGGTENATSAYARDSATGDILTDGNGQVNFVVVPDDGYEIESVTPEGGYKNLKAVDSVTYRVTKITGAVTVTVTTKEISAEEEGDGIIHLNGDSIDAAGIAGATVIGTTVTLTDNAAAYDSTALAYVYNIEGTLTDGQIIVAASNKESEIVLNLDNVNVTSSTGNALDATTGKVTLANVSGSTSTFTSTYTYTDTDGTTAGGTGIYSKNDLTIKGADASTKIVANSTAGNGIRCKADLEIGTGDIGVNAGNNGIKGDESIKFTKKAGNITVTAAGDGIKTDAIDSDTFELDTNSSYQPKGTITVNGGTLDITSGGDGIQADYGFITANTPSITIISDTEGIKANTMNEDSWYYTDATLSATATIEGYIQIGGGTINVTSKEDAIKAAGYVNVTDGNITIVAKNGAKSMDGIQSGVSNDDETVYSTGNINISGGTFDITTNGGASGTNKTDESCKGIKAVNAISITGGTFDIDSYDDAIHSNYTVTITGGTFEIASGDDGVHADYWLTMGKEDGADDDYTMNISTSYEALEGSVIEFLSGTTTLYATDDGVNAAGDYEENGTYHGTTTNSTSDLQIAAGPGGGGSPFNPGGGGGGQNPGMDDSSDYGMLYIKGGKLYVRADGDGLDSNGSILMSNGTVVVAGTTRGGNGVFDKGDKSGDSFRVTGGTLVGFGTTAMQDNPTVSGQGYLSTTTNLTIGSVINVKTSNGYIGIIPEITLSRGLLFVTSPEMSSGGSSIYSGSVSYSDSDKLLGRTVSGTWYGIYKK